MPDATAALSAALAERAAELRGIPAEQLPPALLDLSVRSVALPGQADASVVRPAEWDQLRHEEGGAGRPVPYWARLWPSGEALARWVARHPPPAGARVLELGAGLALPSLVAARAGADVLVTDGNEDAVACAAVALALNEVDAEVAVADWSERGEALVRRGPWDLVLAADVLYTLENARTGARLFPRLLKPDGVMLLADPGRGPSKELLAAVRGVMSVTSRSLGADADDHPATEVPRLHELRLRA